MSKQKLSAALQCFIVAIALTIMYPVITNTSDIGYAILLCAVAALVTGGLCHLASLFVDSLDLN